MGEIVEKKRNVAHRRPASGPAAWLRPAAVLGAAVAASLVWAMAHLVLGVPVRRPTFDGSAPPALVTAPVVLAVAALIGGAGWTLLCLLERISARPRRVWTMAASLALLVSLGAPLSGGGASVADRVVLIALHLTVGVMLIPPLAASAVTRRRPTGLSDQPASGGPTASPES